MFYENELRLLCETFQKCHIRAVTLLTSDPISSIMNTEMYSLFGVGPDGLSVKEHLGELETNTVYKYTDNFGLCYRYLILPSSRSQMLIIGPYLSAPVSSKKIFEIGENMGLGARSVRYLEEYYQEKTVLSEESALFVMLDTFCEFIWQDPSFAIVDVNRDYNIPVSPINEFSHSDNFDDVIMSMKVMEKRYEYENELMQAVTLGQIQKESLLTLFSEHGFERRVADPVRNSKNYCIIMNTLLRKAAENGGVHPVYLDRVSSDFASKIEQLSMESDTLEIMRNMFRSYCRLVRKHSMKKYSKIVQNTILLVDSDLAADLSLHSLARNQNISSGYLSAIFKKETGKTVSEYIREKRIKHATHLLSTTRLHVQTVAMHCGIMDVQYFSKIFKRQTGKTPKEYRESMK